MFSFLSSYPKKVLNTILALCFLAVVLVSCDSSIADDDSVSGGGSVPAQLRGDWTSTGGDGYIIDGDTLAYVSLWDGVNYGFVGNIRSVSNFNSSSGVIIIEYSSGAFYEEAYPFTATYYRNLNGNTVQLSNAYDPTNVRTDTAALYEAKEKFTQHSIGNYAAMWGTYTK